MSVGSVKISHIVSNRQMYVYGRERFSGEGGHFSLPAGESRQLRRMEGGDVRVARKTLPSRDRFVEIFGFTKVAFLKKEEIKLVKKKSCGKFYH